MEGNHQCDSAAARAQDISAKQETPWPRQQQVNMMGKKGVKCQHSKGTLTSEWLNYQTVYRLTYFTAPAKGKKRKPVEAHEESAGGKCRMFSNIFPMWQPEVDATPPAKWAKQITTTAKTPETPRQWYSTRGGGLRRHVVPKAMLKDKHWINSHFTL